MIKEPVIIRDLRTGDIECAMNLVLAEGWNQTPTDWQLFIKNRLNKCKVAEIEEKLVGTACTINYSNNITWISMILVNKKYRRQGISTILLKSILHEINNHKIVKLDATQSGQPLYEKFGFSDEYQVLNLVNTSYENLPNTDFEIVPQLITKKDIPAIIQFDKCTFGADRTNLIQSLLSEYPERSWIIKHGNKITGFALGRKGNKYHRIGPVSTQSLIEAKILFYHALKNLFGQPVVCDIPEFNPEFIQWLTSMGFVKQRYFTRMFKNKDQLASGIKGQFAISGPEFG